MIITTLKSGQLLSDLNMLVLLQEVHVIAYIHKNTAYSANHILRLGSIEDFNTNNNC